MIADVPAVVRAVTEPVDEPIVAILMFPLLQVPPAVASERFVVPLSHTLFVPVIASIGLTVTVAVVLHPPDPV